MTYSNIAREYLISEGLPPDRIIKIGSPMLEVINNNKSRINKSKTLSKLKIESNKFFLLSCHREENVDNDINLNKLINCINFLSDKYQMPVIFPIHPRTKKRIDQNNLKLDKLIKVIEPLGFSDYCKLQQESFVVLSDSGTIFEESSILNFRALNLRESHERPEAIEESSVVITGLNKNRIIQGIQVLQSQDKGELRNINIVADYNIGNVSLKVERIILSYIDYVNRLVWQKES
jgi:UDP-N-acetylglucosamine 2-epimerase (non-hydrolysing)